MVTFDDDLLNPDTLEICSVDRHACQCPAPLNTTGYQEQVKATSLNIFTWQLKCARLAQHTAKFETLTGIKVNVDCITDATINRDQFHAEILSEARLGTGLYDGYTLGPHLFGDLNLVDGLVDLTPFVRKESGPRSQRTTVADLAWNDIFRFNRENGAVYDKKIVGIPIDGDIHSIYYRIDLFDKYNKIPPATWEEYTELAKFFHGKVEPLPGNSNINATDVRISGSCVGRTERTEYWTFLIMSSMTQYAGTSQGAFFDLETMEPLLGEAYVKTLQFMEEQHIYGDPNEYSGNFKEINIDRMNQGRCAMTYMWGDAYTEAAKAPPDSVISGYLGTAFTPGSRVYLNRETQKLELCTEEICSCGNANFPGKEGEGCINSAPYAAFTGWAGSCSNFVAPAQKQACAEWFAYISSPETSVADAIPNVTFGAPFISVDPYRTSQVQLADWIERGLPEESSRIYLETIEKQLSDTNVVLDMRIPATGEFLFEINAGYIRHLTVMKNKRDAGLEGDDLLSTDAERWELERDIRRRWKEIVATYDDMHTAPLLEAYQKNLGVFSGDASSSNQISNLSILLGIVAGVVIIVVVAVVYLVRDNLFKNDAVWKISLKEIKFTDPPEIVGRGRFGLVLLGEYRGTEVAVKRVIPPSEKKSKRIARQDKSRESGNVAENGKDDAFGGEKGNTLSNNSHHSGDNWGNRSANRENFDFMSEWFKEEGDATVAATVKNGPKNGVSSMNTSALSLEKESANRRQLKKDFVSEIRLLSALRHPCIATAVGAIVSAKEDPMLVMEYFHHGSLYDMLHNNTIVLEGNLCLQILLDISQGMRFLHAMEPQIIHCDLKAANILVDGRYRAKVTDFGLSKNAKATGTPFWMAPELLRGKSPNTAASDAYAFGIMLYEMFARKDPYEGEDPIEILHQVCDKTVSKRPVMPIDCPSQFQSLMSDCLVVDPLERPTFEEVDKRLKRVDVKMLDASQKTNKSTISLFDIFPRHIAEALRDGRPVEAEHRDIVTIFFSDIVGFTDISGSLEPRKVANMLGRLYDKLDDLSSKHDVFKVETIGDAYMAVTNLVKQQPDDHVKRIAEFSVAAIAAANSTYIDTDDPERGFLNIRVGFHCGPIVADVVGSVNPRYCLFGDAVNTASRMESNSIVNRIHCSERAAELLQDQHPSISVTSRGLIDVKGKGEMHTYWVSDDNDDDPLGSSVISNPRRVSIKATKEKPKRMSSQAQSVRQLLAKKRTSVQSV